MLEVHEVDLRSALLEEALRFAYVVVVVDAEDLNFHGAQGRWLGRVAPAPEIELHEPSAATGFRLNCWFTVGDIELGAT